MNTVNEPGFGQETPTITSGSEPPRQMTQVEQRVAIAQACGWTEVNIEHRREWDKPWPSGFDLKKQYDWVPDYLNDLNAMHEAEKVLLKDVRLYLDYCGKLVVLCGGAHDALFATAAQRCEAFLKTLGLWKEDV